MAAAIKMISVTVDASSDRGRSGTKVQRAQLKAATSSYATGWLKNAAMGISSGAART